jgi:hypothetical protein
MARLAFVLVVLIASCVAAKLSSDEQLIVAVADHGTQIPNYDFGAIMGSASHDFVIEPQTATDDDLLLSMDFQSPCPDFAFAPATVMGMPEICGGVASGFAPNLGTCPHSYPFTVTFTPSSAGMESCKIIIKTMPATTGTSGSGSGSGSGSNGTTQLSFVVKGTGLAPPNAFTLSPTTLDFGSVPTGTTSGSQSVTLTNTGASSIVITPMGAVSAAYMFSPPLSPVTLAPTAFKTYGVTCTPNAGANDSSVDFVGSGAGTKTLTLSCIGANTKLDVSPNPIAFGKQIIGGPALTKPIMLTNSGAITISITAVSLDSPNGDVDFTGSVGQYSLLPGAHITPFTVRYTPTHEIDLGTIATLHITANGEDLTFPVTGAALNGSIGTNPASVDLGAVCTGSTVNQDVEVYASGRADVTIDLDPMHPAQPFSAMLASGVLGGSHNGAATLVASVSPGSADLGPLTSQIVIDTNIPGEPTYPVDITATGVPMGVAPTPAALSFGEILVDTTSAAKRVDFSNCGGSGIDVTAAMLTGDTDSFTIVSPSADMIATHLDNTKSETFLIVMSPHQASTRTAQLQIQSSAGTKVVDLTGDGVKPQIDRETYYACATSHGSGGVPIVGAIVLVLNRRRRSRAS